MSPLKGSPPPGTGRPGFFYGFVVAFASCFLIALTWGTYYTFGVFLKPLTADLGWSVGMTSGAFSLSMLLHGAFAIATGKLNDRFGPRLVLSACGFFFGVGYLLLSRMTALWQFYLFYGIIAIGLSGAIVPLSSAVTRWFVKLRGLMTGIAMAGIGIGTLMMAPVANWLISIYDWRTSYAIIGGVVLVLIVLAAQLLKGDPRKMGLQPYGLSETTKGGLGPKAGDFSLREAAATWQFWALAIWQFSYMFSMQTAMVHIVPYAREQGMSAAIAANVLAFIGAVSIAGRLVLGSTADRIGGKGALILGFAALGVPFFWLPAARDVWALGGFAIIFGLGYGGLASVFPLVIAVLFGLKAHGTIFGITFFGGTIGGAISASLAGYTFDLSGSYTMVFLICGILSLAVGGLALFLKAPPRKANS